VSSLDGPVLTTEHLILRPPSGEDLDGWATFSAEPETMNFWGRGGAFRRLALALRNGRSLAQGADGGRVASADSIALACAAGRSARHAARQGAMIYWIRVMRRSCSPPEPTARDPRPLALMNGANGTSAHPITPARHERRLRMITPLTQ
jgi:hypothetical protein